MRWALGLFVSPGSCSGLSAFPWPDSESRGLRIPDSTVGKLLALSPRTGPGGILGRGRQAFRPNGMESTRLVDPRSPEFLKSWGPVPRTWLQPTWPAGSPRKAPNRQSAVTPPHPTPHPCPTQPVPLHQGPESLSFSCTPRSHPSPWREHQKTLITPPYGASGSRHLAHAYNPSSSGG